MRNHNANIFLSGGDARMWLWQILIPTWATFFNRKAATKMRLFITQKALDIYLRALGTDHASAGKTKGTPSQGPSQGADKAAARTRTSIHQCRPCCSLAANGNECLPRQPTPRGRSFCRRLPLPA